MAAMKIWNVLQQTVQMHTKVEELSRAVEKLSLRVGQQNERLIRLETFTELATQGRLRAPQSNP